MKVNRHWLHGVIAQKMELLVTTAVRTSNATDVQNSIPGRNVGPKVVFNEWILGIGLRRRNDLIMKLTTRLRLVSG
jgi:hypothetical protein